MGSNHEVRVTVTPGTPALSPPEIEFGDGNMVSWAAGRHRSRDRRRDSNPRLSLFEGEVSVACAPGGAELHS